MKIKLCTVKLHSIVDVITNSSTELFCVVKAKSEEEVENVIREILAECGCNALDNRDGLTVQPHENWNEGTRESNIEVGQFDIYYEHHLPPCAMIKRRIREVFEIAQEGY